MENTNKKMGNPWLRIQHRDYENHMSEVGQSQVLNNLTKLYLDKYQPDSFAILGCATGNGLEHIKSDITNSVYAIDINQEYLNITKHRFENKIKNLKILKIDIQRDTLLMDNIDLFFIGLVLEYVEPEIALKKIIETLNKKGILVIVIQKNKLTSFVTKTKYKSLEQLASISNEVNEKKICKFIQLENMELIYRDEIDLTANKSFIVLEYRKKELTKHDLLKKNLFNKSLNDLTTEELGHLFPIIIQDYNSKWIKLYQDEKQLITSAFTKSDIVRIDHIGSTAIPGLKAKPTIDILLQVSNQIDIQKLNNGFKSLNYHLIKQPDNPPPHITFVKGYTKLGFKGQAYHVHIRYKGDWDEIRFRDYLIKHNDIAKKYEVLKLELAKKFKNDREAYTNSKTNFIKKINRLTKR